jgi:hypothetical protein
VRASGRTNSRLRGNDEYGLLQEAQPTGYFRVAEQLTVEPPFKPWQDQSQGPGPVTLVAFPALQRFVIGARVKLSSFAAPHAPFTMIFAEQCAVAPPFDPAQVQVQGPFPVTIDGLPALHRPDEGFSDKFPLLEEPQTPITSTLAEQLAGDPPLMPTQVQSHGPVPVTAEGVPALQRFNVGAFRKLFPRAEPQAPFTSRLAEQLAGGPPLDPAQVQLHGPFPFMEDAFPALQRFDFGAIR